MPITRDVNDGKPWSNEDISDLRHSIAWGENIEEAARVLCRSGTVDEVERKARELGLRTKQRSDEGASEFR
jgi:hypothetical protein